MWRVHIVKTFLKVLSFLLIQVFMTILNFSWINLVSFLKFLCVKFIILREVNVNKTSQSMTICTNSYVTILITVLINNLFPQSA